MNPKRRDLLKKMGLIGGTTLVPSILTCGCRHHDSFEMDLGKLVNSGPASKVENVSEMTPIKEETISVVSHEKFEDLHNNHDSKNKLIAKSRDFDKDFSDDIYMVGDEYKILLSVVDKLNKLQKYVGHGHFNVVDWNDGVAFTKKARGTGSGFTKEEIIFLEKIFYRDAVEYGFMGEKVFKEIDRGINRKNTIKVPYSGHFLVKGQSHELYKSIKKKLGSDLILTSGVRCTMKQFSLFLNKVIDCGGNASKASRSIAPPGYSFHGRGDFDIGSRYLGYKNFTSDFAKTDEYKKLVELGFVNIRYEQDNLQGVRFEPWHIKVDV